MGDIFRDPFDQQIKLTEEQQACIDYNGERTLMVKGCAGSGKSIVLMAAAKKYQEAYRDADTPKVAIFTFQNTLVSTIKETLGCDDEKPGAVFVGTCSLFLNEIYQSFVAMGIAPKIRFLGSNNKKQQADRIRIATVESILQKHRELYGRHRFQEVEAAFWLEEFDWMKDMNFWLGDRDAYLNTPRTGRSGRVRMSAEDRVVAFQLFELYCQQLAKKHLGDWADQALYIIRHQDQLPEKYKYRHVLIDEAQDLSLAQMMALRCAAQKDMLIAMDANQRIHKKHWSPKLLGISATTKKLTKSMRTTKQIDELAESIRRHNDQSLDEDDRSIRAIPEREGPKPELVHLETAAEEKKFVVKQVRDYLAQNPNLTIGIIGAKNNQLDKFGGWFSEESIPYEIISKDTTFSMKKPGVKIVSAFSAKGLEFHVVMIPMFAKGYFPYDYSSGDPEEQRAFLTQMRNLAYVSMTRAKNRLIITYWGQGGSPFIGEMDKEAYLPKGAPIDGSFAGLSPIAPERTGTPIEVKLPPTAAPKEPPVSALTQFLANAEVSYEDSRGKGGALWIFGEPRVLKAVIDTTRKLYGAMWLYSEKKKGYFTKCTK